MLTPYDADQGHGLEECHFDLGCSTRGRELPNTRQRTGNDGGEGDDRGGGGRDGCQLCGDVLSGEHGRAIAPLEGRRVRPWEPSHPAQAVSETSAEEGGGGGKPGCVCGRMGW